MKRWVVILLSLPFLVFGIVFDVIKFPILLLILPIWTLMALIYFLRGDQFELLDMMVFVSFIGIAMWMEIAGIDQPRWMDRL